MKRRATKHYVVLFVAGVGLARCTAPTVRPSRVASQPLRGGFVPIDDLVRVQASLDATANIYAEYTSGLITDVTGDGIPDLVDNRGVHTELFAHEASGTWSALPPIPNIGDCVLAADLDRDGATDIVCLTPVLQVIWGQHAAAPDWMHPTALGPEWEASSVTAWDIDEDGWTDLLFARFGPEQAVYRNTGRRRFENVANRWGLDVRSMNFATVVHDLDGDGRNDILFQNDGVGKINHLFRRTGVDAQGDPTYELATPIESMSHDQAVFLRESDNPMGAAAADFDGDGVPELFFAMNVENQLYRHDDQRVWRDVARVFEIPLQTTSTGAYAVYWSPALWDFDHDDRIDLFVPMGSGIGEQSMPNRGTSQLLVVHGSSERFETVQSAIGLGDAGEYLTLALDDFDLDGDLDVITGGNHQPVRIHENRIETASSHTLVRLHGTVSEVDGRGATVATTDAARPQQWVVGARFALKANGAPVTDLALPVGSTDVRIDWPSGYHQVVRRVGAAPYLDVTEPRFVQIDPASRHVPADGVSVATVRVESLDADGAPRPAAEVTIEVMAGDAQWTGPVSIDAAGVATRSLRSSGHAGSAVIRIAIDGVEVGVRPRVWFDEG